MNEDNVTNPEMEVIAEPESQEAVFEDHAESEDVDAQADDQEIELDDEAEEGTDDESPEYAAIDYEGEQYEVPTALKEAFLRNADYTRKTQELAESRKTIEARETALNDQAQAFQENFESYADLRTLESQLAAYDQVDWDGLVDSDPEQAQKLDIERRRIERVYQQQTRDFQQKQAQRNHTQQQAIAKQSEESRAILQRDINGWSPDYENNLKQYGQQHGLNEAQLNEAITAFPDHIKILDKAYRYDQLQQKAKQKPRTPKAKPLKTVKSRKSAATNGIHDEMSTEDFFKTRNAQLRKKRL